MSNSTTSHREALLVAAATLGWFHPKFQYLWCVHGLEVLENSWTWHTVVRAYQGHVQTSMYELFEHVAIILLHVFFPCTLWVTTASTFAQAGGAYWSEATPTSNAEISKRAVRRPVSLGFTSIPFVAAELTSERGGRWQRNTPEGPSLVLLHTT